MKTIEKKVVHTNLDFTKFSSAVAAQFKAMSDQTLCRVRLTTEPFETGEAGVARTKDILWGAYQAAWPEGTNEIFRTRREHDCQCCKSFVRTVGGVVAIVDGALVSIWDVEVPEPYKTVAAIMSELSIVRRVLA
jgi:hypothetical protein